MDIPYLSDKFFKRHENIILDKSETICDENMKNANKDELRIAIVGGDVTE